MNKTTMIGLLMGVLLHAGSGVALAQDAARLPEAKGSAITWVIGIALVLVVSIAAFINPKRSHRA